MHSAEEYQKKLKLKGEVAALRAAASVVGSDIDRIVGALKESGDLTL